MKTDDERLHEAMAQIVNTFGDTAQMVLIKIDEADPGVMNLRIAHQNIDAAQTIAVMSKAAEILRAAHELHDAPTLH